MRRPRSWVAILLGAVLLIAVLGDVSEARRRRKRHRRPARVVPAVPALTAQGLPNVQSLSALVIDLESRRIIFGKNPDRIRHIASTGKIFTAMVARRRGIDLAAATAITMDDARAARGGARTRLDVGESYSNRDLMLAMLVASDNRAVTAVGRAVGLTSDQLVAEMNALARELGLERTSFTDATGLNGNVSTAREMAIALRATLEDPILAELLATRFTSINRVSHKRPRPIHYANTNRMLHRDRFGTLGGKTGYTREAGYCLVSASLVNGRRVAFVFLGADGELTRYGDFNRVWDWLAANGTIRPEDTGAAAATVRAQKAEDSR